MKVLVWSITAVVVAVWSLLAWLAHGLVGMAGQLVASNADIVPADPLFIEWASWLAGAGTGVGEWLVVAVWALVSLLVLAAGGLAAWLLPRGRSLSAPRA